MSRHPGKNIDLEGRHRQRRFNLIVISGMLITTVIVVAYSLAYNAPLPPVSLPAYLNQCISLTERPIYVSSPTIQILIHGSSYNVPANIGVSTSCIRPINTRGPTGVIHIDAFENRTFTLGDFFLVWGATYGPEFAIFNRSQIFLYKADVNNNITVTLNGYPDPIFNIQDTPFPHNANATTNPALYIISYG